VLQDYDVAILEEAHREHAAAQEQLASASGKLVRALITVLQPEDHNGNSKH
jgi:hypothetical protein